MRIETSVPGSSGEDKSAGMSTQGSTSSWTLRAAGNARCVAQTAFIIGSSSLLVNWIDSIQRGRRTPPCGAVVEAWTTTANIAFTESEGDPHNTHYRKSRSRMRSTARWGRLWLTCGGTRYVADVGASRHSTQLNRRSCIHDSLQAFCCPELRRVWLLYRADAAAPIRAFQGHTFWMAWVAVSPDGRCLVTGSYDNTAKLWARLRNRGADRP